MGLLTIITFARQKRSRKTGTTKGSVRHLPGSSIQVEPNCPGHESPPAFLGIWKIRPWPSSRRPSVHRPRCRRRSRPDGCGNTPRPRKPPAGKAWDYVATISSGVIPRRSRQIAMCWTLMRWPRICGLPPQKPGFTPQYSPMTGSTFSDKTVSEIAAFIGMCA